MGLKIIQASRSTATQVQANTLLYIMLSHENKKKKKANIGSIRLRLFQVSEGYVLSQNDSSLFSTPFFHTKVR